MSSSERRQGKPGKVWDAVMNWAAGGSGSSRQQFRAYNGQERPVTTRASSTPRRERPATASSTPQTPRRVDYQWRDAGEIGKRATVIERLEEKVARLERLLQETTTTVATKADSIERLKIKVVDLNELVQAKMAEGNPPGSPRSPRKSRDVGFLTGKVVELNQLLQEKTDQLSDVEHIAHEQIARKEEEIIQLEAEVTQLNRLLQDKTAEHSSAERAANERIEKQEREIGLLQAQVARLNRLQEQTVKTSIAEDAENKQEVVHRDSSASDKKQREEKRAKTSPPHPSTEDVKPPSPTIVRKADTISVAEVADLVRISNSQIEQTSTLIMDSLSYRESPISSEELQDVLNELNDYIGPWLYNDLRSKSNEFNMEPDLITQLTLQTGLVNACSYIINYGVPPADGMTLSRIHDNMAEAGQAVADTWKALARTYTTTSQSESWEVNRKYLAWITLKLITAVGGSLEGGVLPPQYNEKLEDIVRKALELHRIVSREVVSMELVTYTMPCGAWFDPSRMEDTEGVGDETGPIAPDTVICTLEMGLQCGKRKESGSGEEWGVTTKAKVVLASTLDA